MNKRNNLLLRRELETLSNLRLSEMLREELQRDRPDGDKVRLLLQVLEAREENTPPIDDRAVAAWERFQRDCAADTPAPQPRKRRNRWLQLGAIAAVLCLVLLAIPSARGNDNFFFRVGTWKNTILEFFHPSEVQQEYIFRTDHPGLQKVYDEVSALGVTKPVVPSWLPIECMLTELKITTTPSKVRVYAEFSDGKKNVYFTVSIFGTDVPREYEIDNPDAEHIELEGIIHSVTGNEDTRVAFWSRDNIECSLSVDHEEGILDRILNSIYVTEANKMKRFIKIVCIVLVLSTLLAVPVSAESEAAPYGSIYFIEYSTYLYRVGTNQYEIWFEVTAKGPMEELGVCEIVLQRSTDGENWSNVLTYSPEGHPQMLCENTGMHADCVYYMGSTGWQYRAFVTFYAKNSNGYGKRYVYAYPIN